MTFTALQHALPIATADPAIARLVARLPHRLALAVGDQALTVCAGPGGDTPGVTARAPAEVWAQMLVPLPPPGRQSVGAAMRSGSGFVLEGAPLAVAQTLPLLEMLVEALRKASHPGQAPAERAQPPIALDRIRSRYVPVEWPAGDRCWLFEESAGDPSQPVLLMLHTAGADSRQWHALMADEDLGRHWHLVAFDMPCHGRSRPPEGWRGEPWTLDTARYLACIRAWMQATGTQRVALAGCSMGAAISLAFAAKHPDECHGGILLETPCRSPGRRTELLDHPGVHGGRFGAAWVQALLSPASPEQHRRFATWIYSQAAPGVYEGDLAFYSDEFDAMEHVGAIDTRRTPLWLMTGDYDYSATPADSRRVAQEIAGAQFTEMQGLGHFPMTEDPQRLLTYFRPAAKAMRAGIASV